MALSDTKPIRRDSSIDLVRGLVMCLMVLDHARDFFTSTPFSATDPDKTSVALFFTRWVTHFCAPAFVLLAGVGAGISRSHGGSPKTLSAFLLKRGIWLMSLELTWVRFGWHFDFDYHSATGQVVWALGCSMVVLAALVFVPDAVIAAFGSLLVVGHNLFDSVHASELGSAGPIWRIVHEGGPIPVFDGHFFYVAYPLVPWIGVMALGFVLGRRWATLTSKRLVALGLVLIAAFFCFRLSNLYGDPKAFVARRGVRSLFALLNCQKYPPSLAYLLMTLGPIFILLGFLRGRAMRAPLANILVTLGRVPLFFYLLHLPLVHAMTLPLRAARGLPLIAGAFRHRLDVPLTWVYLVTLLAVVILWLPCRRWAELKADRPHGWLSYL